MGMGAAHHMAATITNADSVWLLEKGRHDTASISNANGLNMKWHALAKWLEAVRLRCKGLVGNHGRRGSKICAGASDNRHHCKSGYQNCGKPCITTKLAIHFLTSDEILRVSGWLLVMAPLPTDAKAQPYSVYRVLFCHRISQGEKCKSQRSKIYLRFASLYKILL